jgi:hypothetical protein
MDDEFFYVAIRLGNDAFGHQPDRAATADDMRPEIVRILQAAIRHIECVGRHQLQDDPLRPGHSLRLLDENGNTVGRLGVVNAENAKLFVHAGLTSLADGEGTV